ncbi:MAG: methylmalonyl-CoA mutase family protein, partial [Bacteroidota bacterium]
MNNPEVYKPQHHIRIVTAASLFDGHDAAINIMRRILQSSGAEVIHLGHNRSVREVVDCAIQEDAQAVAITSYQGGHMEYFKYMFDLFRERNCGHIKIFGGGGGVILPGEISELHEYGIARIYSPDDGRKMTLQGMINDLLEQCDFPVGNKETYDLGKIRNKDVKEIAGLISAAENYPEKGRTFFDNISLEASGKNIPVLGITGTGGAGKSSLVDEIVRRFLADMPDQTLAIISIDPTKRKTGGALLGDRIRMNAIFNPRVYMRSLATRQSNLALSKYVRDAINITKVAGFDMVIVETSGIGQSDTEIVDHSDVTLYVMTPEYGAASQLEKIDMLDFADLVAINKFDKRGALDALRDVKKQYQRNHKFFDIPVEEMPVYGTVASQFNDPGVNDLYRALVSGIKTITQIALPSRFAEDAETADKIFIIPPSRTRYLAEIAEANRAYNRWTTAQAKIAQRLYAIAQTIEALSGPATKSTQPARAGSLNKTGTMLELDLLYEQTLKLLDPANHEILKNWDEKVRSYRDDFYVFKVRDKEIRIETHYESLSHLKIPKISLPGYEAWGDILKWNLKENVPGEFPYAAGVFPFKRESEDPTRMFAGEGGPERTNKRFHYVSFGMPFVRLSTAYDSVTLYGFDPDLRPDIYGKIGNAGVSISCLDDAKKLYSGFDLVNPNTSVSMTINGPAPAMVGYFMNAAIDQQCEKYIRQQGMEGEVEKKIEAIYKKAGTRRPHYQGDLPKGNDGLGLMLLGVTGDQVLPETVYEKIKKEALSQVRGTVQAD